MLSKEALDYLSKRTEEGFGMLYDEFYKLDIDEQQWLISKFRENSNRKKDNKVTAIFGSCEQPFISEVKKGETVMVGSGEDSCFVRAGVTPEESRQNLDNMLDDAFYCKPVAFVKKLQRKIKNTFRK